MRPAVPLAAGVSSEGLLTLPSQKPVARIDKIKSVRVNLFLVTKSSCNLSTVLNEGFSNEDDGTHKSTSSLVHEGKLNPEAQAAIFRAGNSETSKFRFFVARSASIPYKLDLTTYRNKSQTGNLNIR
jgi:hypothetical protein